MIKMIVMDMDGTLLNNNSELTDYTIKTLKKAQEKGVILVLSSGRSYVTLSKYGSQLEMNKHNGYYICVNGIALYNCATDENKYLEKLHRKDEQFIFSKLKDENVELFGVNDNYLYDYIADEYKKEKIQYCIDNGLSSDVITGGPKGIVHDQTKNGYKIYYVDNFDEADDVNKMIIAQKKDVLKDILDRKGKEIFEKYTPKFTTENWCEVSPYGVSKGNTLKMLANKLNIDLNDVMVFGDGENDLSMLEIVGYSVCMKNGMDTVKQKTKYITDYDNDNDGVAKFTEKMLSL